MGLIIGFDVMSFWMRNKHIDCLTQTRTSQHISPYSQSQLLQMNIIEFSSQLVPDLSAQQLGALRLVSKLVNARSCHSNTTKSETIIKFGDETNYLLVVYVFD